MLLDELGFDDKELETIRKAVMELATGTSLKSTSIIRKPVVDDPDPDNEQDWEIVSMSDSTTEKAPDASIVKLLLSTKQEDEEDVSDLLDELRKLENPNRDLDLESIL